MPTRYAGLIYRICTETIKVSINKLLYATYAVCNTKGPGRGEAIVQAQLPNYSVAFVLWI